MNKTSIISLLGVGGAILIAIVVLFGTALSYHNEASALKNQYDMKLKDNSSQFDNMWKKIKQSAQVPEEKKKAFAEIFNSYAQNRSTGGENQMMTWIQESVPNVDLSVYDQLMNIITSSRDSWTMKQTELVSIAEQHNLLLVKQPSGIILSVLGHEKINPTVITSEKTEAAFSSGQDNDLSIR